MNVCKLTASFCTLVYFNFSSTARQDKMVNVPLPYISTKPWESLTYFQGDGL